jgi:hypothetical protein
MAINSEKLDGMLNLIFMTALAVTVYGLERWWRSRHPWPRKFRVHALLLPGRMDQPGPATQRAGNPLGHRLDRGGHRSRLASLVQSRRAATLSYLWQGGVLWWGHLRRVRPIAVPNLRVGGER